LIPTDAAEAKVFGAAIENVLSANHAEAKLKEFDLAETALH
jgi:hypothetical protein